MCDRANSKGRRSALALHPHADCTAINRATNVEDIWFVRPALKPRRRLPTAAHHTIPCAGLITTPRLGKGTSRSNAVFRVRRLRGAPQAPNEITARESGQSFACHHGAISLRVWTPRLTRGYCVPYAGSQLIRHPPKAAGTGLDRPQSGKAITASGIRPDSHWPCVLP